MWHHPLDGGNAQRDPRTLPVPALVSFRLRCSATHRAKGVGVHNTTENSDDTPVATTARLPLPAGPALPPPAGPPAQLEQPPAPLAAPPAPLAHEPAQLAEPHVATELEHPSIVGKLAEPADDGIDTDEALAALASLPPEALAPPTFLDPIGLPEATRLSVLALFQDRASVWNRLDELEPHQMEFERAVQRSFGPGQAPELDPLTPDGDPEAEVHALRDAVSADLERVRELNAAISSYKIEIQRLENTSSHVVLWLFVLLVLAGGGAAAAIFLL